MRKQVVPTKGYYLNILLGDVGLGDVTLRTTVLEEPPWERPWVGRTLSGWCGLVGEASITPGFNFLTWEAEIKVPAHS